MSKNGREGEGDVCPSKLRHRDTDLLIFGEVLQTKEETIRRERGRKRNEVVLKTGLWGVGDGGV